MALLKYLSLTGTRTGRAEDLLVQWNISDLNLISKLTGTGSTNLNGTEDVLESAKYYTQARLWETMQLFWLDNQVSG